MPSVIACFEGDDETKDKLLKHLETDKTYSKGLEMDVFTFRLTQTGVFVVDILANLLYEMETKSKFEPLRVVF